MKPGDVGHVVYTVFKRIDLSVSTSTSNDVDRTFHNRQHVRTLPSRVVLSPVMLHGVGC
jgi:hypothetical protein